MPAASASSVRTADAMYSACGRPSAYWRAAGVGHEVRIARLPGVAVWDLATGDYRNEVNGSLYPF